ncbi:MAG: alkaline phosphatase family protein [Planctomycetes bacterium]|nr:alkaline phosphatase family protein [Planctomycetota bacterium]
MPNAEYTTGLGTPDALGTFHTFTLFTEPYHALVGGFTEMGGRVERLEFKNGVAVAKLAGPPGKFKRELWEQWEAGKLANMPREEIAIEVRRADGAVTLTFPAEQNIAPITLKVGQWTEHLRLHFMLGGMMRYPGLAKFKLLEGGNAVRLYATPVTFDPLEVPAPFRVSTPPDFAAELAHKHGDYTTLGWPEATSALNDGAIDDQTFLETCEHIFTERKKQWLAILDKPGEWDMAACFFYDIDRICHMMWRHFDPKHPAHDAVAAAQFKDKIRDAYERSDKLVGEVLKRLPGDTVLLICSDHGFLPFYRAVNLNAWLIQEGYAVLKGEANDATMRDLFTDKSEFFGEFDWSKTRAYAMGLGKIYINTRGREPSGIVAPKDAPALMDEIKARLEALRDGDKRVVHEVFRARDIWQDWGGGVPRDESDLEVGFADGYRISWQNTLGGTNEPVISDNLRNWSGDHCTFAPELVPGVVFSNRKLQAGGKGFRLIDVGDTVLKHFGVDPAHDRGHFDGDGWTVQ